VHKTLGSMAASALMGVVLLAGNWPAAADSPPADVDGTRIVAADHDPRNCLTYGRNYGEQRFSPLTRVTATPLVIGPNTALTQPNAGLNKIVAGMTYPGGER
jgi:glucose dehydrogenase